MYTLVTRPFKESISLGRKLEGINIKVIVEPLLTIRILRHAGPEVQRMLALQPQLVATTSVNAIEALAQFTNDRNFSLIVVGETSAQRAISLGFKNVVAADGNVESLYNLILRDFPPGRGYILYLRGGRVAVDLISALEEACFQAKQIEVYDAVVADSFSTNLQQLFYKKEISRIVFFSKRTAVVFLELARKYNIINKLTNIVVYCISEKIAKTISDYTWQEIKITKKHTEQAIIELIRQEYE